MLLAGLFALLLYPAGQEMMIPEGTILPVVLNETLNTARVQENDPVLFSLAEDIRAAGRRGPILIPRGSDVVGRIVRSQRAGHFIGRSQMDIHVQEIITPTGEVYDGLSAKIVDVARKKGEKGEVKADGGIQGPGSCAATRSCPTTRAAGGGSDICERSRDPGSTSGALSGRHSSRPFPRIRPSV